MTLRLFTLALIAPLLMQTGAEPVSVKDLDEDATTWNGRVVTVRGEVVGDYGVRGDVTWIQVNDDAYVERPLAEHGELRGTNTGIGVRLPADTPVESWGPPGGDEFRGPIIKVTGRFLYNDPAVAGDTFVDASEIELIEASRRMPARPARLVHLVVGSGFVASGLIVFGVARNRRLNPADERR